MLSGSMMRFIVANGFIISQVAHPKTHKRGAQDWADAVGIRRLGRVSVGDEDQGTCDEGMRRKDQGSPKAEGWFVGAP